MNDFFGLPVKSCGIIVIYETSRCRRRAAGVNMRGGSQEQHELRASFTFFHTTRGLPDVSAPAVPCLEHCILLFSAVEIGGWCTKVSSTHECTVTIC